jgi:uncharacterized protein
MVEKWQGSIEPYRRSLHARLERRQTEREAARQKALAAATAVIPQLAAMWPSIERVYLFGSILRPGAFHKWSDIDVAVAGITPEAYFGFWKALEEALPNWLIDLRDIDTPSLFSDRVKQNGVLLYVRAD